MRLLQVSALLLAVSCTAQSEAELKMEAAVMARATEVIRNSPYEAKAGPLISLQQTACSAEDVCALKAICLDAYAKHVAAVEGINVARRRMATTKPGTTDPETAGIVQTSEKALNDSRALATKCSDQETALRIKYKL